MPRFFGRPDLGGVLTLGCGFLFLVALVPVARSASPLTKADKLADAQPLFEAIAAGDLEATVVPRDAQQLTVQLKNKTERPLTIQMPPALAAAPILAQQQQQPFGPFNNNPFNNNAANNNNNNRQAPQQLGFGAGQGNMGGGLGRGIQGGIFNIPAGRAIKIKAACVCLEYGKPNPDARMKYELKPLAEVNDSPALAKVLRSLGDELIDQRTAQAAAWHVTDDLSWDQLVGLVARQVGGVKEMQFKTGEVAAAKALLDKIKASEKAFGGTKYTATSASRDFSRSADQGNRDGGGFHAYGISAAHFSGN